jgi:hypothetical protein
MEIPEEQYARQCEFDEPASAQRNPVRSRRGGTSIAFRPRAYDLYAHESMAKCGVLDRVFEQMQMEQIVPIKIETFALDSTSVKVHADDTGA